jgi:hypothetical protein
VWRRKGRIASELGGTINLASTPTLSLGKQIIDDNSQFVNVGQVEDSPLGSLLIGDLSILLIEESRSFSNVVTSKEDLMSVAYDYTPPTSNKRTFGCEMEPNTFSSKFINIDSFFPFSYFGDDKDVFGLETSYQLDNIKNNKDPSSTSVPSEPH